MRMTDILGNQSFAASLSRALWQAMGTTGNGYRKHSLRNTGRGDDRRKDKLETRETRLMRQYRNQFKGAVNSRDATRI